VELLSYEQRRALVGVPVEEQSRSLDARQDVSQIGLGEGAGHNPVSDWMKLGHDRGDLGGRGVREQALQTQGVDERGQAVREVGQAEGLWQI
jgi:hypothetical protein